MPHTNEDGCPVSRPRTHTHIHTEEAKVIKQEATRCPCCSGHGM